MKCDEIRDQFSAFIDGELSEDEKLIFLDHLASCEDCRAEFDLFTGVMKIFHEEELIPLPEGFHNRLMAKVKETGIDGVVKKKVKNKRFNNRFIQSIIAICACFIFFILSDQLPQKGYQPDNPAGKQTVATDNSSLSPRSAHSDKQTTVNSNDIDVAGLRSTIKDSEMEVYKSSSADLQSINYDTGNQRNSNNVESAVAEEPESMLRVDCGQMNIYLSDITVSEALEQVKANGNNVKLSSYDNVIYIYCNDVVAEGIYNHFYNNNQLSYVERKTYGNRDDISKLEERYAGLCKDKSELSATLKTLDPLSDRYETISKKIVTVDSKKKDIRELIESVYVKITVK